jgi:hypothetical protein
MLLFAQAGAGQLVAIRLNQPQPEDVVAAYSLKNRSRPEDDSLQQVSSFQPAHGH